MIIHRIKTIKLLKQNLYLYVLTFLSLIGISGCKKVEKDILSIVHVNTLNIREKPSLRSNKIGTFSKGDTLIVKKLSLTESFAQIKYKDKDAYVSVEYIHPITIKKSKLISSIKGDWGIFCVFLFIVSWILLIIGNQILKRVNWVEENDTFTNLKPGVFSILKKTHSFIVRILFFGDEVSPLILYWIFDGIYIISLPLLMFITPINHQLTNPYNMGYEFLGFHIESSALLAFLLAFLILPFIIYTTIISLKIIRSKQNQKVWIIPVGLIMSIPAIYMSILFLTAVLLIFFLKTVLSFAHSGARTAHYMNKRDSYTGQKH